MIWRFTLYLKDVDEMTMELSDRLFGACDDCSPSSSGGRSEVSFDREALTLEQAIRSAVADVESVGVQIESLQIESEDLEWTHA